MAPSAEEAAGMVPLVAWVVGVWACSEEEIESPPGEVGCTAPQQQAI